MDGWIHSLVWVWFMHCFHTLWAVTVCTVPETTFSSGPVVFTQIQWTGLWRQEYLGPCQRLNNQVHLLLKRHVSLQLLSQLFWTTCGSYCTHFHSQSQEWCDTLGWLTLPVGWIMAKQIYSPFNSFKRNCKVCYWLWLDSLPWMQNWALWPHPQPAQLAPICMSCPKRWFYWQFELLELAVVYEREGIHPNRQGSLISSANTQHAIHSDTPLSSPMCMMVVSVHLATTAIFL